MKTKEDSSLMRRNKRREALQTEKAEVSKVTLSMS